ncbi:hypothetical protein EDD33_2601 [Nocardioides aurantiacus]|uniref:Uncharacterized protein n=1 Tax=Nocardioides aurantiacus TaxID=86796 RepID=A0A3N2CW85_9ACTN|nr:hypothetical protein EDD33_2601 [Nocardioides aurantiacus]
MTRRRPPTWITTAAGWVGGKVADGCSWFFETKVDEPRCRWANETHMGRGPDD